MKVSNPSVSVVIPTHNPRAHSFARVIAALRAQTLPVVRWELVVVDSASTAPLASSLDLSWHPNARVIREDTPGSARARVRGIKEATADLLVMVDDDNVLSEGYLAAALAISEKWPILGAWGGSISPEFESKPAPEVEPYLHMLALREITAPLWSNVLTCTDCVPWGAGMCLRREAAIKYVEAFEGPGIQLHGRVGKNLFGAEDTEMCIVCCKNGWGVGVFPELRVLHLIPSFRVTPEYLVDLMESSQVSRHVVDYKWRGVFPPPVFSPLSIARHVLNFVKMRGLARRMYFASVRSRLTARKFIQGSVGGDDPQGASQSAG